MTRKAFSSIFKPLAVTLGSLLVSSVHAGISVQCPGDKNGDADFTDPGEASDSKHPNATCMHIAGGDGFIKMADGKVLYTFGFSDMTGVPPDQVMTAGRLAANFPAPTIELKEGDEFYLTLSNVGFNGRPDLSDPHSVHFHGFPNASAIFDGMPEGSIAPNMQSSLTYYYNIVDPGTFMYHCHVEAPEHMQMGMLGNLYVHPKQNGRSFSYQGKRYTKFVYNDNDGSTGYDVEFPIQIGSMDPIFHDLHLAIQPLPFANMKDTYAMLNGRGYPDTTNPSPLVPPADNGGILSQTQSSLITATRGQHILLRISNLNITNFYTLTALGLPMKVVGSGAKILRGPSGKNLYYNTQSVTLGGGEAADVIIDTTAVPAGTYFLYTTNLNHLSNNTEDYGGMMTEIVVN